MSSTIIHSSIVLGQVTTERFTAVHIPAALRSTVDAFNAHYKALKLADAKTQNALVAHESAITRTQSAHEDLRASLAALAAAIGHADPAARVHPFASFDSSPTKILRKTRAGVARATQELANEVLASSPTKSVRDAANECSKHAKRLLAAHSSLNPLAGDLKGAQTQRRAIVADFANAFKRMKALAKCVWRDSPGDYAKVFAPIERFNQDSKRRKGKSKANPAPSDQPAAQPPAPPVQQPAPTPAAPPTPNPNHLLN
jgi:hypothetical protein